MSLLFARTAVQMALSVTLLSLVTSGCFLFPAKKAGKGGAQATLIDRESIYIDRVGDGSSAILKFKTARPALCELGLYNQDENAEPKKDTPRIIPCSDGTPRQEFSEQLKELRSDYLYYVTITMWTPETTKDLGETIVVREQPGDPLDGAPQSGDGKFRSLVVTRFNAPVRTAEVHRFSFPEPVDIGTVRERLARAPGCRAQPLPVEAAFNEADQRLGLVSVSTRGFGSATAKAHPVHDNRLRLYFNALQYGNPEWEWTFESDGTSQMLKARSASRFTGLEISSNAKISLAEGTLAKQEGLLAIDVSKPLKLLWQWENLPDNAWVSAQVRSPEKSLSCIFEAKTGVGEIPAELLTTLPNGTHRILVQLESWQLLAGKSWLIRSVDWRTARIEKQ
jgi:hypothetical protein